MGTVNTRSVIAAVDFLPTVAELAGVTLPSNLNLDGENISDALFGSPWKRKKSLYWQYRFEARGRSIDRSPMLAIRKGRWKLLMNPDFTRMELYDMNDSPRELNNVFDENGYGTSSIAQQQLSESLMRWQAELPEGPGDPLAGSDSYPTEDQLGLL